MYRPHHCGKCYTTTVRQQRRRRQQQQQQQQRVCLLPIPIHLRTSHSTTIIYLNTKNRYSNHSIYIEPSKVLTPYFQQRCINSKPRQYFTWRFISDRFIGLHSHKSSNNYNETQNYTEFLRLQRHSRRSISDDSKRTTIASESNSSKETNMNQSTTTTPSTPPSNKDNPNNTSVAKIDTNTELTKEEEEEVRPN